MILSLARTKSSYAGKIHKMNITIKGQWVWPVRVWNLPSLSTDWSVGNTWRLQEVRLRRVEFCKMFTLLLWPQVHFMHKRPWLWSIDSGEPWMSRGPSLCKRVRNLDWNRDAFTLVTRYGDPDVPGTGQCVDYDRATACKTFNQPTTPCLYSCPRWVG